MNLCPLRKARQRYLWTLALTPFLVAAQSESNFAASITWDTPSAVSGVGDTIVSTQGTLVTAVNFDADSVAGQMVRTVNTVSFAPQHSLSGWQAVAFNADLYVDGNVGTDFERMLDSFVFGFAEAPSATQTLTLSGLTLNQIYQVQFFVADDRLVNNLNTRTQNFTGGSSTSATTANGFSYSLLGTFVANSTTQLITITGYPGTSANGLGNPILNAYQVRDLGAVIVPEPSTALLAGVGIVGLLMFARRQVKIRRK